MIPKIIHYCWLGGSPLPPLADQFIASWKKYMPSWQVMLRSEGINELENEGDSLNIKQSTLNIYFLHIFPVHYFCPLLTTGEDVRTPETYCEHKGESSWAVSTGWKAKLLKFINPKLRTKLIKLKRKLFD